MLWWLYWIAPGEYTRIEKEAAHRRNNPITPLGILTRDSAFWDVLHGAVFPIQTAPRRRLGNDGE